MEREPVSWLTWTERVLAALVALAAVATAVGLIAGFTTGFTVQVPADLLPEVTGAHPAALLDAATISPQGTVGVEIADPTVGQGLALALGWVPALAMAMVALVLLLRLVRDARRSGPFTGATVRRLRAVAVVALIGGPLGIAGQAGSTALLTRSVLRTGGDVAPHITFEWLLLGLGFLAVAEVVRTGIAMRDELDEVI